MPALGTWRARSAFPALMLSAAAVLLPCALRAQSQGTADPCRPGPASNEAKVFAMKAVGLAFAPAGGVGPLAAGAGRVTLEGSLLPDVNDARATPTICRPGKGPENVNPLFGFVRPRVAVGIGAGFFVEASWIPPIRINGVRPNLFGFAVGNALDLGATGTMMLRAHATVGEIRGPFTCPDAALLDPRSECLGGKRSEDRYQPNAFGADVTFAWHLGGGAVTPYFGGGYNRLEPRFQVNFTNAAGSTDNRRVVVGLNRGVFFGGVTWRAVGGFSVSGEAYGAPADTVAGRVSVTYRL